MSGTAFIIDRGDAGHNKNFVDINSAVDFIHDFKAIATSLIIVK